MVNLEALAKLATEATPGLWHAHRQPHGSPWWIESESERSVADVDRAQDAAYIAAASPDVVLALVRVAQAADFRASVKFDKGWHGADLLDGIAAWMDRKDDDRDMAAGATSSDRTVQADVRRWASELRAALADLDR